MNLYIIRAICAISAAALVLSACKGAAKPVTAGPVQKRVVEEPKKITPDEEKALAQEKLLKEAKEEFDKLCEKADQLIAEKKFAEAAETLLSYPEKFAQTEFKPKIAEKIQEIEKLKKEEEERIFNEEAQSLAQESIKRADALAAEKRFAEALDLLNSYPEKYAQTIFSKAVKEKTAEVERLKAEEEEHQKFLREAEEEFKKRKEEAEALAAKNDFDSALALLDQYPEKFAQTEWKKNIRQIAADILKRKAAYEEDLRFLAEAKDAAEKTLSSARALTMEKKFDEALSALASYPEKYASTESADEITREVETVKKMKEDYEKEQKFLASAKEECKNRIEKAKELMKQDKYEDALKVLSEYPPEYSKTEWDEIPKIFSRVIVQYEKAQYEAHQKLLQDAKDAFESVVKDADALAAAKRFEEARALLANFPEEYQIFYSAQITAKDKGILDKKEKYERKKIMTLVGAIILGAVVLLSVIVLVVRRSPTVEEE